MENTLSSLFASVEWRQLPWLQQSEAEARFEARGGDGNKVAPNVEIVQMALWEVAGVSTLAGAVDGNKWSLLTSNLRVSAPVNKTRPISHNYLLLRGSVRWIIWEMCLLRASLRSFPVHLFFKAPRGNFQCTPIKMQIVSAAWCPPGRIIAEY